MFDVDTVYKYKCLYKTSNSKLKLIKVPRSGFNVYFLVLIYNNLKAYKQQVK